MSQNATPIIIQQPQQGVPSPLFSNECPARVKVALDYLAIMMAKGMKRVYLTGEHTFVEVDGQELTKSEANTQDAAATLLADYFRGTVEPDVWESALHNRTDRAAAQVFGGGPCGCPACHSQRGEPAVEVTERLDGRGHEMKCPVCNGSPVCGLCRGAGRIVVFPGNQGPSGEG